ncbi:MAG: glycoside hydrolase family 2 TIM barrel-domain containing protein [Fibrobacterota bacterium]
MFRYLLLLLLLPFPLHAAYSSLIAADDMDLTGVWQVSLDNVDKDIWNDTVRNKHLKSFQPADPFKGVLELLSGLGDSAYAKVSEIPYAWFVKRVYIPRTRTGKWAALNIGKTRWRYEAWFNRTKLGEHLGGFSPRTFDVSSADIRFGDTNTLTLKIGGWPTLPFSSAVKKKPLVMRGAPWGKGGPAIHDGVWLEFFDEQRLKDVKIETSIKPPEATVKIWLDNAADVDARITFTVAILPWKGNMPIAKPVSLTLDPARSFTTQPDAPFIIKIPCPNAALWSPAKPGLYEARIIITNDGRLCQEKRVRFGFRTFEARQGRFLLNGEPVKLRGSDLYDQCIWFGDKARDRAFAKKMLIADMRSFNCTAFRTHTGPFTDDWLDLCDEEGALVLCEFPITVNFGDFNFTPEEWDVFHTNAMREAAFMIPHYWNRPSVIIWVMTNESHQDSVWELGPFSDLFRKMDSTRPLNRSCFNTPEIADIHDYSGAWYGSAGDFQEKMKVFAETWRKAGKPIIQSEFQGFRGEIASRLVLSRSRKEMGPLENEIAEAFTARIDMEQTEFLRLLNFDGIFPYAGIASGFSAKDSGARVPTLEQRAIRNALAPVMVSINTLDPHYTCGSKAALEIVAANDMNKPMAVRVTVGVSPDDPGYDYSDTLKKRILKPVQVSGLLPALGTKTWAVTLDIPQDPRRYYFLALVEYAGGANMSQRICIAIKRPEWPLELLNRRIGILEQGGALRDFLSKKGFKGIMPADSLFSADLVVMGWNLAATDSLLALEPRLRQYAENGGSILVLEQRSWPFTALCPLRVERMGGRAGAEMVFINGLVQPVWKGIESDRLWRMNGLNQALFQYALLGLPEGAAVICEGKECNRDKDFFTAQAEIRTGKGKLLFNQIKMKGRLDEKAKNFDPAALTLFLNLLRWK